MKNATAAIALALLICFSPCVQGQHAPGHQQDQYTKTVLKVAGTVEAGEFVAVVTYPASVAQVGSVFTLGAHFSGPLITGVGGAIGIGALTGLVGCSAGTPASGSNVMSLTGAYAYFSAPITVTARECTGVVPVAVSTTLGVLWQARMPFSVHTLDVPQNVTSNYPTPPAFPSTLNVTNSGAIDVDISGALEILAIPDLHIYIEEWPDLFASTAISEWPELVANLSGSVEVTGVEIDASVGNQTNLLNFTNTTFDAGGAAQEEFVGFWVPFLFWIVVVGIAAWFRWYFILGFSIPGFINVMLPAVVPGSFETYIFWCLLGLVLEVFTSRRRVAENRMEL